MLCWQILQVKHIVIRSKEKGRKFHREIDTRDGTIVDRTKSNFPCNEIQLSVKQFCKKRKIIFDVRARQKSYCHVQIVMEAAPDRKCESEGEIDQKEIENLIKIKQGKRPNVKEM